MSDKSSEDEKTGPNLLSELDRTTSASKILDSRALQRHNEKTMAKRMLFLAFFLGVVYGAVETWKTRTMIQAQKEVPRLAHVVQETQGFRRINYIGLIIMVLSGACVLMGMMGYRMLRASRARRHDSMFYFLATLSVGLGIFYLASCVRRRKESSFKRALRSVRYERRFVDYLPVLLIFSFVGMLIYRRYSHQVHMKRKRARAKHISDRNAQQHIM